MDNSTYKKFTVRQTATLILITLIVIIFMILLILKKKNNDSNSLYRHTVTINSSSLNSISQVGRSRVVKNTTASDSLSTSMSYFEKTNQITFIRK